MELQFLVAGTGNQTQTVEFTSEQTKTNSYDYLLPDDVIRIDVYVQEEYISRKPNVVAADAFKNVIYVIPV